MKLLCPNFKHGQKMPKKYSKDGGNISPIFIFRNVPKDIDRLKLKCTDPEQQYIHWNIDFKPRTKKIIENVQRKDPESVIEVFKNSGGRRMYNGPSPIKGETHKYNFLLFAIKETKIIAKAKLIVYY